ncbi:hypothetical protein TeGR_g2502 [Tetraparma gracilis]|uniref:AMP-dependent synthetase/ligase domain-containing protein n=1 Tax=Tetraparma gracilis TaxID=2962635 RepID=A0ABQ6MJP1_9STRA|nr:hypothetical protein TeGR_g2502 [Tetraparma gracilis]
MLAQSRLLSGPAGRRLLRPALSGLPAARSLSAAPAHETGPHMQDGLLQFTTLHEIQTRSAAQWSSKPLFGTYDAGAFGWMSYGEFDEKVARARAALVGLGVKPGSTVGVISNNRWEWAAVSLASYSLSAVMTPMYEAQLPSDWSYIMNDAGCEVLLCATQDIYDRSVKEVKPQAPQLQHVLCFDAPAGEPHAFATAMAAAEVSQSNLVPPKPEDLANLIYTSGTTGKPKGVELTHHNQVSNMYGTRATVADPTDFMRTNDRSLSFLPWAHSYGQTCELYSMMAHGAAIGVCRGVPDILEDLQLVKPSILFSVPTLYKRVYDGVQNMIETTNPIRRTLMRKALDLGENESDAGGKGRRRRFDDDI